MSDHEGLPLTADAAAVEGRQRKWPLQGRLALVVALMVLIAAAINITYLRSVAAPESCNKGHSSNSLAMPHRCNFSTMSASAAAWMPTCYPLDDSASAVLDPTVLQLLQERQQQSQLVDDWLQLGSSSSRSALRCTSFSIPKVIHQTWLGKAPQPKRWIDTFRWVGVPASQPWIQIDLAEHPKHICSTASAKGGSSSSLQGMIRLLSWSTAAVKIQVCLAQLSGTGCWQPLHWY
jgi:hypothetical protein